ncbi:UBP-type zinc finger domain-containing protein [Streptomyces sp. UNOC14_S4]|uniref:UBP-type zinc finger domain-containing protein n=1 Tax=Streptomyces sp. UNOC14_S4 TaxID=2872340 RepID=UPI001E5DBCF0|nr:UBP-type zinc finger domain-containing protein [Streptomyces sp. UNOC14_S4]MCC3769816.1 UBP-type zinc finger domain-containing protein [Streptomyces sp. UNOC14_S4]
MTDGRTTWRVAADVEGRPTRRDCAHLGQARDVEPSTTEGCEDCLRIGSTWLHLRECLVCGHVGCCDSSPKQHASAHAHAEPGHDLARSFEPGEQWAWCYVDGLLLLPR